MSDRDTLAVNKPPHYSLPGHDLECIDVIEALQMPLHVGSAFQYLWRAGRRDGLAKGDAHQQLVDLKKARWYIERRIQQLEVAQRGPDPGAGVVEIHGNHGHWRPS